MRPAPKTASCSVVERLASPGIHAEATQRPALCGGEAGKS